MRCQHFAPRSHTGSKLTTRASLPACSKPYYVEQDTTLSIDVLNLKDCLGSHLQWIQASRSFYTSSANRTPQMNRWYYPSSTYSPTPYLLQHTDSILASSLCMALIQEAHPTLLERPGPMLQVTFGRKINCRSYCLMRESFFSRTTHVSRGM
jgi:hypothetical protein